MGRVLSTVIWVFLGSPDTRNVGHSRKACEKWVGTPDMLTDTPKDLLVTCCETNLREPHEILSNQASNVNDTRPETHARADFMSSLSTASYGTSGDRNLGTLVLSTVFSIMSDVARLKTQIQLQKAKVHE